MNFCTHCGNQLKPDARFCSKCGQVVKEGIKSNPAKPSQQLLCSKCGTVLAAGVRFCISCGAPAQLSAVQLPPPIGPVAENTHPIQAPQPPGQTAQPRIQAQSSGNPPKKKKGKKILAIAVSTIVLLAAAGAALYFFGTYEPKESYTDLSPLYEEEKLDETKVESAASAVEQIFLAADTAKLTEILSPTTLEQKRQFFRELQPHMAAFGQDFKSRKFLYGTARFAVYEFSSAKGTFTAEFCLGEDGKWKLMRF